jgi:hypothetical protein
VPKTHKMSVDLSALNNRKASNDVLCFKCFKLELQAYAVIYVPGRLVRELGRADACRSERRQLNRLDP